MKKLREKYKVYCIMNNLVENEKGFRDYKIDQEMLERIRNKRKRLDKSLSKWYNVIRR